MAEKRKFSDGKTFGRPKFRTEKIFGQKKIRKFFCPKVFVLNVVVSFVSIIDLGQNVPIFHSGTWRVTFG